MGFDDTPKKVSLLRLWWVPCLLTIVCLLVVPFFRPIQFEVESKRYSLQAETLPANHPYLSEGVFIRNGWDGPTGEFTSGEFFGIKLGKCLLKFDIIEAPMEDAQRRLPATLEGLVEALNSKDSWLRLGAMQRLEEMGGAALVAIPVLVIRVEQGDAQAEGALAVISKAAGERAVPALTNLLTHHSPALREKAAEILGEIGLPAKASIPLLRERRCDPQPKVMVRSAIALRKIDGRGEGAVPVLVNMLTNSQPELRGLAAVGLGQFGSDASAAIPGLIQCLDDSDIQVRMMAARTLGLIGVSMRGAKGGVSFGTNTANAIPKLKILAEGKGLAAEWGMNALSAMGLEAAPILADIYKAADNSRRIHAARALMKLGTDAGEAIPVLLADLGGTNAGRALLSAQIIGHLGEKGTVALPQLQELLNHPNIRVRVQAAGAIWRLDRNTNAVLPVLIGALQDESINRHVAKRYAAETAGEMGAAAKDAVPLLQAMLNERQSGLRYAAAEALEKIGGHRERVKD